METYVYQGRLLSNADFTRLQMFVPSTQLRRFCTKITRGAFAVHLPGRCAMLGRDTQFLDHQERTEGRVDIARAWKFLADLPHVKKRAWNETASKEDENELLRLLALVAERPGMEVPKLLICEVSWTVLEDGKFGTFIAYNVPCHK
jgi:hypothetical protein